MTFTTTTGSPKHEKTFGRSRLISTRLRLKHGKAGIPLQCVGVAGSACKGTFTVRIPVGHGKRARRLVCGAGKFVASGGHSHVVHVKLGQRCAALVTAAPHQRLRATVRGVFSTHQTPLRRGVTLFGT